MGNQTLTYLIIITDLQKFCFAMTMFVSFLVGILKKAVLSRNGCVIILYVLTP